jgi:3-hydroxy-9,10-secoandrosta-1,3,5(10)-triene-9,17-dione monooxygenase reductase component
MVSTGTGRVPDGVMEHVHETVQFRSVLGHFATGVAVVTALQEQRPVGMTVQSLSSLSLEPPMIVLCPALTSTSWPHIASARGLCVNLLTESQERIARKFAQSGADKFAGVEWTPSAVTGSPVLNDVLAWIECRVAYTYPGGDHLIVACEVIALGGGETSSAPLIYFKSSFGRMLA